MPNLSNPVTFLFAGDGSLASDGLAAFFQTRSNFLLVAQCNDGQSAIESITSQSPEIAVIDAQLPDMSALAIVERVRAGNAVTKLIILGASPSRAAADQLLAAGADAFVVRSGPSRHLNEAIRYVRDGGKYLSPQLTQDMPVAAVSGMQVQSEADVEAFANLRNSVDAQARTVERLEDAMGRAQYAIELLQQKIEQITGAPLEAPQASPAPPYQSSEKSSRFPGIPSLKSSAAAFAAMLIVGVLGFQLAGILRPNGGRANLEPLAEFAGTGAEDSLNPKSSSALHLPDWQNQMVERSAALLKNQQFSSAEKVCRELLKENPGNLAAARILASALFHQDRIEESADVVRSMANPLAQNRQTRAAPLRLSFRN